MRAPSVLVLITLAAQLLACEEPEIALHVPPMPFAVQRGGSVAVEITVTSDDVSGRANVYRESEADHDVVIASTAVAIGTPHLLEIEVTEQAALGRHDTAILAAADHPHDRGETLLYWNVLLIDVVPPAGSP